MCGYAAVSGRAGDYGADVPPRVPGYLYADVRAAVPVRDAGRQFLFPADRQYHCLRGAPYLLETAAAFCQGADFGMIECYRVGRKSVR